MFVMKPWLRILLIAVLLLVVLVPSIAIAMSSGGMAAGPRQDTSQEETPTSTDAGISLAALPTFTPTATAVWKGFYASVAENQRVLSEVDARDEDILFFANCCWSKYLNGAQAGLNNTDLAAFSFIDPDTILMVVSTTITVNGVTATPQDILRFDRTTSSFGTFSLYFDGSDVGLDDATNEKIDALSYQPDGSLLISTNGNPTVSGVSGAKDEDVLAFAPTSLGDTTAGTWSMYFDGSDVGLGDSNEDVDAVDVVDGKIYLSTRDDFSVPGISGANEDVFVCDIISTGSTTACNYETELYLDGSVWGMSDNNVDGFYYLKSGRPATATPTPSSPGDTLTLFPEVDTYVSEAAPTTNYGNASFLQVDASPGDNKISYLRFTASSIPGTIQSVRLRVYCTTNPTVNGPALYTADNTWVERGTGGMTWNTRVPLTSGELGNQGAIGTNTWVEYDVTAIVTGSGTYTFALVGDDGDGVTFSSVNGNPRPELVIVTAP